MYNICMNDLIFEWDENKNRINKKKHRVSFEEAASVFYDYDGLVISDPDHSFEEDRFLIIGTSRHANILTVVHCVRESEAVIRIISARASTKKESRTYYKRRGE